MKGNTNWSRRDAWIDARTFKAGSLAGYPHWPALLIEAASPGYFDERFSKQELTCLAIQHVKEAVPVGPKDDLALLALPLDVGQDWYLYGIKIEIA